VGATVKVSVDLQTVICQEPSVSRESVAARKLQHPADASLTIWWCQFEHPVLARRPRPFRAPD
jgi:hypothetical protein